MTCSQIGTGLILYWQKVLLNVAKELMGHSDISVTAKIYTHMVDEVFKQNRKRLAEYANQKEQKAVNE